MEIVAVGIPLIGGALWLKHRPSLALVCFGSAAWLTAMGEAAQYFNARKAVYMAEARERGVA